MVEQGVITSPVTAGGNSLSDSTKSWRGDVFENYLVAVTDLGGRREVRVVGGNAGDSLIIRGTWVLNFPIGSGYEIIEIDLMQAIRDVLGGGANINAANPLPVDTSPGVKTIQQILTLANLAAAATSTLAQCTALDLRAGQGTLALTVVGTYNAAATLGLRVHVRTSPDNVNWDSEDWDAWTAGFTAGAVLRETENYDTDPLFVRVLIENLDPAQAITNLAVIASIGV